LADPSHPSEEPVAVMSPTRITASNVEPQQEGGLFQSFANMSDYAFTAMAAASGTNEQHAFGSRKDDAVNLSLILFEKAFTCSSYNLTKYFYI